VTVHVRHQIVGRTRMNECRRMEGQQLMSEWRCHCECDWVSQWRWVAQLTLSLPQRWRLRTATGHTYTRVGNHHTKRMVNNW